VKKELEIFDYLKDIKDPRLDRKKLHLLIDILVIAISAVICGADNWNEIEDFGHAKEKWFKKFLKLPNGIPSHDTFNRVFSLLTPEWFSESTMSFFVSKIGEIREHIAIDGKTIRRSGDKKNDKSAIHIVSAWLSESGLSIGQVKVDDKSNEITAIPELLDRLEIQHSIVSIDAMGAQKKITEKITEKKADYVIALKENHPILYNEVHSFFKSSYDNKFIDTKFQYRITKEKSHGRIEKREYWLVSNIDWISQRDEWSNLNSIGMVRSEITIGDKTTTAVRYYLSSLKNAPVLFQNSVREHWTIETSCHWVLDVAFREDESRARNAHAAENFSILRKVALNLLKNEKSCKLGIHGKRLKCGWDDDYFLKVLGFGNDTNN
jgi:predicted transposase YbfD/YdcC